MAKKRFTRTTVEVKFEDLDPMFIRRLRAYIEMHSLGTIENDILRCYVTKNEKKGFLGRTITNNTVLCASDTFMFWGNIEDKDEPGIAGAQFSEISDVKDYESTEAVMIYEDHGLELFGFIYKWSRRSTWLIMLGNDEPGNNCRTFLKSRIVKK